MNSNAAFPWMIEHVVSVASVHDKVRRLAVVADHLYFRDDMRPIGERSDAAMYPDCQRRAVGDARQRPRDRVSSVEPDIRDDVEAFRLHQCSELLVFVGRINLLRPRHVSVHRAVGADDSGERA